MGKVMYRVHKDFRTAQPIYKVYGKPAISFRSGESANTKSP
jgi:hypothetical protein